MKKRVQARMLDGVNPQGLEGELELVENRLIFSSGEMSFEYAYLEVLDLKLLGADYQLTIKPISDVIPSAKIIFWEPSFHVALNEWMDVNVGNTSLRLARAWRRVPVSLLLLICLVVIPLFYVVYVGGFTKLHFIVSVEKEVALGELLWPQFTKQYPECDDVVANEKLQSLVDQLVDPASPYDVRVCLLDTDEVNAFAFPGGRIAVFRGLLDLCPNPEALAGVLAHEVAHIERRHTMKHIFRSMGVLVFMNFAIGGGMGELESIEASTEMLGFIFILKYSRNAEAEADEISVQKLAKINADPKGIVGFFEEIQDAEPDFMRNLKWVRSHPVTDDRILSVRAHADNLNLLKPYRFNWAEEWTICRNACQHAQNGKVD